MNINRHNYEEYFILYMDNELSSAERRMVETFVQHHPDLKEELDILLQSKFTPDHSVVFENKNDLLKITEENAITISNYEEWLSLYIDDELTKEQKAEVEMLAAAHPQIQTELLLLQKTKLQPDTIIFPDKNLLYRRSEKVRLIRMQWWRVAAAAILLLAISTTAYFFINNHKKQPGGPVAVNPVPEEKKNTNPAITIISKETGKQNTNAAEMTEPAVKQSPLPDQKVDISRYVRNNSPVKNNLPENNTTLKKADPVLANFNPTNNLPLPDNNPNLKSNVTVDGAIAENPAKNIIPTPNIEKPVTKETSDAYLTNTNSSGKTNTNPDAVWASSKETNTLEEGGQNKKSRGFFRKAVRFFEKTTKINPANDDDQVLIGGLAVKLN
jgi:hypothetical protein